MRIVHFHPDFGDQINIIPKYQVNQGNEVYILTGKSDLPHPRFLNFAYNSNMVLIPFTFNGKIQRKLSAH